MGDMKLSYFSRLEIQMYMLWVIKYRFYGTTLFLPKFWRKTNRFYNESNIQNKTQINHLAFDKNKVLET